MSNEVDLPEMPDKFCSKCGNCRRNRNRTASNGYPRGPEPYGKCFAFEQINFDDAGIIWYANNPCMFQDASEFQQGEEENF